MRGLSLLFALLLTTAPLMAQERTLPTPGDAVNLAFGDFLSLDAESQRYARYIFVPSGTPEQMAGIALAVNCISRSPLPYRPAAFRKGRTLLLRVDLRKLAEDEGKGLERVVRTWEELEGDPWFRYSLKGPGRTAESKTVKKKIGETRTKCKLCRGFGHFNDKSDCKQCVGGVVVKETFVDEVITAPGVKGGDIFVPGLHAGGAGPALLMRDLSGSNAAIVHGGYFVIRALDTLDLGFGRGLYRRFLGTDGLTQKQLLESVGASETDAAKFASDQRLVQISNVTGRPRTVVFVRAIGGAGVSRSMGVVMWTLDPSRKSYDPRFDGFLNLLDVDFDAIEMFFPLPNGMIGSDLFDKQGNQQDAAPPDVAADRRIPEPHSTELSAGLISCARCHGTAVYGDKEASFLQPLNNEVRDLLSLIEPDIDFAALNLTRDEYYKRVAGLYTWEPEADVLPLTRIFYSRAVAACTAYGFEGNGGALTTRQAWTEVVSLHTRFAYSRVDAEEALAQIGYEVPPGGEAIETLFGIAATSDDALPDGIAFDSSALKRADPTLALLKIRDPFTGDARKITAVQWSQVYSSVAYKAALREPNGIRLLDRPAAR